MLNSNLLDQDCVYSWSVKQCCKWFRWVSPYTVPVFHILDTGNKFQGLIVTFSNFQSCDKFMSIVFTEVLQEYLRGREWKVGIYFRPSTWLKSPCSLNLLPQQSVEMFVKANCKEFSSAKTFSHEHYKIWKVFYCFLLCSFFTMARDDRVCCRPSKRSWNKF